MCKCGGATEANAADSGAPCDGALGAPHRPRVGPGRLCWSPAGQRIGRTGAAVSPRVGGDNAMALTFERSWSEEDLERYRGSVSRFVETEMLPAGCALRAQRGHVGHAIWRRAGDARPLCADIPERLRRRRRRLPARGGVLRGDSARRGTDRHSAIGVHSIVAHYVLNHGTEEQKQRWLPRMASGELRRRHRHDRAGRGLGPAGHRTRAERRGDHYVINGCKTFITNGYLAGLVLVVRQDRPGAARATAPRS